VSDVAMTSAIESSLRRELEQLFRDNYQMLYRTAYSILDNREDAEDVPQTIFLKLLRIGVSPDLRKNAKGYLYRAVVNQSLSILRSRKRRPVTSSGERLETLVGAAEIDKHLCGDQIIRQEDRHRRLSEAIAELAPQTAHILLLRYVHNFSDAEIATLLNTSRGAIAVRLYRSRARLKKLMRHLSENDYETH
jgi:RNA polymerase sigma-70 factor (ECF subfamily)